MSEKSPFVVDADWLQGELGRPGLSVVDASWYLPGQGRDARAEYNAAHIPGAIFFDQDLVVDPDSDLPHTLPRPGIFAQHVGSMGISADDTIVVYDGPGMFAAPRVWWMFRVMGAPEVFILDGGFDNWNAAGRPVTAEPTRTAPNVFHTDFDAGRVASLEDVRRIVETGDARLPMRGRRGVSRAKIPSRARASVRDTCRARGMCRRSRCPTKVFCCRSTNFVASWNMPASIFPSRS